ncbi:MAG: hypothetical protein ACRED0_12770 [Gammaproteobacteria bacterium]
MNAAVIDYSEKLELKECSVAIGAALERVERGVDEARKGWLDIGERLLAARRVMPSNQEFGAWCERQPWAAQINRWYRQAAIRLACRRPQIEPLLARLATKAVTPDYLLELVQETIKLTGGEPIPEIREIESFAVITANAEREGVLPAEAKNPAPEAPKEAPSPEPSCEKTPSDDSDVPPPVAISAKNAALERWGELGAAILTAFSNPNARTVWNQLAGKRHGIEIAKFALGYFERGRVALPTNACVYKPNARLVLPWLNSPFADEYDLGKAAGFEKLKADLAVIERICRPVFATRQRDKGNACFSLFRREMNRPKEEALAARVEALRQRDQKAVNVQNHPPIVVYGEELWPDGDLPENLRLSYDAARWAYFLWSDHEASLSRVEPDVRQRAAIWRSRQRSLQDLAFPVGEALSYFWWRAGTAMREHPEDHRKCFCQPVIRVK